MKTAAVLLAIAVLATAQLSAQTYQLQYRETPGGILKTTNLTGANKLLSTNGSGIVVPLTIGAGLTSASGVLTAAGSTWGSITGDPSLQTDLQGLLNERQPLDADLTAIAGLTTTTFGLGFLEYSDAAAFVADTGVLTTTSSLDPYLLTQRGATDGQSLVWSAANSRWQPGSVSGGGLPSNAAGVLLNNGSGTLSWLATSDGANGVDDAGKIPVYSIDGFIFAKSNVVKGGVNSNDSAAYFSADGLVFFDAAIGASISIAAPVYAADVALTWSAADGQLISTGDLPNIDAASLGSGAATAGKVLTADGSGATAWTTIAGSGIGDVVGPATATNGVPALFDGTTGKLLKNSTPTGTGNPVLANSPTLVTPNLGTPSSITLTWATGLPLSTGTTGQLPIASGGTGTTTASAAFAALAPSQTGNAGKYLTTNGTAASWASVSASGTLAAAVTSGQSTTSTSLVDVTELTVTLDSSSTYIFETDLVVISANSTEALGLAFEGPSGNTFQCFTLMPTNNLGGMIYSYTTSTGSTAMHSGGVNVVAPMRAFGRITTGGAGGTFKVQFRAETGDHAVTIRAGSIFRVTKL